MRATSVFFILFAAVLCASCYSSYLREQGVYDKEVYITGYANKEKTVAFIPMKHIGPKEFYENVKQKIDSLQKHGYIVFMEGTRLRDTITAKEQRDTLELKLRKMLGMYLGKEGYLDTVNNLLAGRKYKHKNRIINQPKYSTLGVDTLKGKYVDVPNAILVNEYERKFGTINLTECDLNTPLKDKYECEREPLSRYNYILLKYRDSNLARYINAAPYDKIAVLYGAAHEQGMYRELRKLDTMWRWKYTMIRHRAR